MKIINVLFAVAIAGRFGQRRRFRHFHHHKRTQNPVQSGNRTIKWVNGRINQQELTEFGSEQNYRYNDPNNNFPDNIKELNPMKLYTKNLRFP